jgi:hypothetical protein
VSDGTRTRDVLDHNQVLYQLSYTHHAPDSEPGSDPTCLPRRDCVWVGGVSLTGLSDDRRRGVPS